MSRVWGSEVLAFKEVSEVLGFKEVSPAKAPFQGDLGRKMRALSLSRKY